MRVGLPVDVIAWDYEALTVQADGCLHATKLERPSVQRSTLGFTHIRQKRPVAFSIRPKRRQGRLGIA